MKAIQGVTALIAAAVGVNVAVSTAQAQWLVNGTSAYYNAGNVGVRTATPGASLHAISATATNAIGVLGAGAAGAAYSTGVRGISYSSSGYGGLFDGGQYGLLSRAQATSGNTVGVWGLVNSPTGYGGLFRGGKYGVYGESTLSNGYAGYFNGRGYFSGYVGLGVTTPTYRLHVLESAGTAVWARSGAASGLAAGVVGESNSPTGFGILGTSTATSGLANGVAGETNSPFGVAINGFARATSGATNGVKGETWSPAGVGVYGLCHSTTGAFNNGVYGESKSNQGIGVYGMGASSFGINSGVTGRTNSLADGWGIFSEGDAGASGFKAFSIDHPQDPGNKYLNHFSAEGPEAILVYRGNAWLDERGEAWVELPTYFESINRDFTYQLTPIGAPALTLHIGQEVKDNKFLIAGGVAGMKVSWMVTGIRNDPYARTYGKPVEQNKPKELRGTYIHPELYGRSRDEARSHRPAPLPSPELLPRMTQAAQEPAAQAPNPDDAPR